MTAPSTTQPTTDPGLQALITAAEQRGLKTVVTLITTGGIVSGTIAGARTWADRFVNEADSGEGSEEILSALDAALREDDASDFIHLEDAAIHEQSIASADMQGNVMWRGRLTEVVGWNIGQA